MNPDKPTDFGGDPRPALSVAWRNLTKNQNLRLTEEDLGQTFVDDSVVKLTDGSGVFATLTVFHGLHCIERLHHYLYFDHYYSTFTEEEKVLLKYHTEHCLDWLRQYVQCNADTTPLMMHWIKEGPLPIAKIKEGEHSCVNWERLDEWAAHRTFVPSDDNMEHPVYGKPYNSSLNKAVGILHTKGAHFVTSNGTILPDR
ncbi:DUF3328 domain containing protein [Pyrenophora tritici-repentis]|nr:DUF3328 domain containing protein [Pyrenophora tritici-repentis]